MKNIFKAFALVAPLYLSTPAVASTVDALDVISSYGVVALNNLQARSESEVPVYVGNNFVSQGYTVNGKGYSDGTIGGITGSLIVGGDVSGNDVNVNAGDAQVGSATGTINTNGGTLTTGISLNALAVSSAFQSLSSDLSALTDTVDAVADASDPNLKSINAGTPDADGISVLSMAADFLSGGTLSSFTIENGASLIVNVSGTNINIQSNFNFDSGNVIFNFYEAEEVTVNSTFGFGILAANADVYLNSGGTDTFVVGENIFQSTEVRGVYTGTLPSVDVAPVPLPASGLLLVGALAAAAGLRRRGKS